MEGGQLSETGAYTLGRAKAVQELVGLYEKSAGTTDSALQSFGTARASFGRSHSLEERPRATSPLLVVEDLRLLLQQDLCQP
jgi:hypothetical protein